MAQPKLGTLAPASLVDDRLQIGVDELRGLDSAVEDVIDHLRGVDVLGADGVHISAMLTQDAPSTGGIEDLLAGKVSRNTVGNCLKRLLHRGKVSKVRQSWWALIRSCPSCTSSLEGCATWATCVDGEKTPIPYLLTARSCATERQQLSQGGDGWQWALNWKCCSVPTCSPPSTNARARPLPRPGRRRGLQAGRVAGVV